MRHLFLFALFCLVIAPAMAVSPYATTRLDAPLEYSGGNSFPVLTEKVDMTLEYGGENLDFKIYFECTTPGDKVGCDDGKSYKTCGTDRKYTACTPCGSGKVWNTSKKSCVSESTSEEKHSKCHAEGGYYSSLHKKCIQCLGDYASAPTDNTESCKIDYDKCNKENGYIVPMAARTPGGNPSYSCTKCPTGSSPKPNNEMGCDWTSSGCSALGGMFNSTDKTCYCENMNAPLSPGDGNDCTKYACTWAGGTWDSANNTCKCPIHKKWNATKKNCECETGWTGVGVQCDKCARGYRMSGNNCVPFTCGDGAQYAEYLGNTCECINPDDDAPIDGNADNGCSEKPQKTKCLSTGGSWKNGKCMCAANATLKGDDVGCECNLGYNFNQNTKVCDLLDNACADGKDKDCSTEHIAGTMVCDANTKLLGACVYSGCVSADYAWNADSTQCIRQLNDGVRDVCGLMGCVNTCADGFNPGENGECISADLICTDAGCTPNESGVVPDVQYSRDTLQMCWACSGNDYAFERCVKTQYSDDQDLDYRRSSSLMYCLAEVS